MWSTNFRIHLTQENKYEKIIQQKSNAIYIDILKAKIDAIFVISGNSTRNEKHRPLLIENEKNDFLKTWPKHAFCQIWIFTKIGKKIYKWRQK